MAGWSRPESSPSIARGSADIHSCAGSLVLPGENMKQLIFAIVTIGVSVAAGQSQVKKLTLEGVTNFAQVETTVACAGAVTPASVAGIKKLGFASLINLRLESEKGADIDAEAAAAKAAGINFVHLSLNTAMPAP